MHEKYYSALLLVSIVEGPLHFVTGVIWTHDPQMSATNLSAKWSRLPKFNNNLLIPMKKKKIFGMPPVKNRHFPPPNTYATIKMRFVALFWYRSH